MLKRPSELKDIFDNGLDPIIEYYSQPWGSGGIFGASYLVLGRVYNPTPGESSVHGVMNGHGEENLRKTCSFSEQEAETIKNRLRSISIPLGFNEAAFDGNHGYIRIHSHSGYIEMGWNNITQSAWEPLLNLIREVRQQIVARPSINSENFNKSV